MRILPTLKRAGSTLASPTAQLAILEDPQQIASGTFNQTLQRHRCGPLRAGSLQTLQINVGKVCNQTCAHCHVDAGPERRESMSAETADQVIDFLARTGLQALDITGGAPEMNPQFRSLVQRATRLGCEVIDRCNLTILLAAGFRDLPEFLAQHRVRIIASLPCYLEQNCDAQRGDGVFAQSIAAIRRLNELGYADNASGLTLDLVYNPVGTSLPPPQAALERDYREQLHTRYGIAFNHLFTITNMPISRFLDDLLRRGEYVDYMQRLMGAFNPETVAGLMCRSLISVDWQGYVYDCDFNQMLELTARQNTKHISDVQPDPLDRLHISQCDRSLLEDRLIRTANHCFGCTAGDGSSCQGTVL